MMSLAQRYELEVLRRDLSWAQGARRPPAERAEAAIMAVFADRLLEGLLDYAPARAWISSATKTIALWREGRTLHHPDDATCCSVSGNALETEI